MQSKSENYTLGNIKGVLSLNKILSSCPKTLFTNVVNHALVKENPTVSIAHKNFLLSQYLGRHLVIFKVEIMRVAFYYIYHQAVVLETRVIFKIVTFSH